MARQGAPQWSALAYGGCRGAATGSCRPVEVINQQGSACAVPSSQIVSLILPSETVSPAGWVRHAPAASEGITEGPSTS